MWHHYNIILENSNITTRPWQRLVISDNLNLLSILVLNIKGKVNKIAIEIYKYKTSTDSLSEYDNLMFLQCIVILCGDHPEVFSLDYFLIQMEICA